MQIGRLPETHADRESGRRPPRPRKPSAKPAPAASDDEPTGPAIKKPPESAPHHIDVTA